MTKYTMDVSIIIVNYKTVDLIIDCLESVYRLTTDIEFETIIVDNNSGDDFESRISKAFPGRNIKFIPLNENIGFGRANNEGFNIAQGRNLLCLNPDTILVNNAVKILSDYLDNHLYCGACGGNLFDEQMQPALSFRRILPGIRWEINELLHLWPEKIAHGRNTRFNYTDNTIDVGYISGADLMIRADLCRQLGGFSPEFFMYYEETDLCARIHRAGYKVVSVPAACIQHLEGGSFDNTTINYGRIERSEKGRMTYMRRNHPPHHRRFGNMIYALFLWSRAALTSRREIFKYRLSLLKKDL